MKFTKDEMLAALPLPANEVWKEGVWDIEAFSRGNLKLLFFAPRGRDYQTEHDDDEIYIIVGGEGQFEMGGETLDFRSGDAIFVPAGVRHRFSKFGPDLAVWAVFF